MAHLWVPDGPVGWAVLPLSGAAVSLAQWPPRVMASDSVVRSAGDVLLVRHGAGAARRWVLLASQDGAVRVNGAPVIGGVRVVEDRDEIWMRGEKPVFFSAEELARVEPFPAEASAKFCARCKLEVQAGSPAVRCPACSVWYHQSDDYPCWVYARTCALCDQPTDLAAGFRWTPEAL
jgi:hypothetical protein